MDNKTLVNNNRKISLEIIVTIGFVIISVSASIIFFAYLNDFHSHNLKKYLMTIARTSVLQIQSDDLNEIYTPEDINKPVFKNLVQYLKQVKENNEDIDYIYIMRKTDNDNYLEFVADATSLETEVDSNNNGVIEGDEKISLPGDKYDLSKAPAMREAFLGPITDDDVTSDQWGDFISGYAPIYDANGQAIAILGVDLKAEDYYALLRRNDVGLYLFVFLFSSIFLIISIITRQYRQQIKILKQLDEQKSDFISLASHQLRTPLSASKWCIHMLHDGDFGLLDEPHKRAVKNLCNVNERMVDLVNDLLKVSQVDADKIKTNFSKVDLKKLCTKIIKENQYLIDEKSINFSFQLDEQIKHIKTDKDLLREVLVNLLINAIKYTPIKNEIKLNIYRENSKIFFQVKDSGYGIPKKEQERIFTKFFRASNIVKKDLSGTGLGLYFVKKVVELLGGKISFTSQIKKGTTFSFYLPYNY